MIPILSPESRPHALKLIALSALALLWGFLVLWKIPLSLGTLLGVLAGCVIAAPFIAAEIQTRRLRLIALVLFVFSAHLPTLALWFREILTFSAWLKAFFIILLFTASFAGLGALLRWLGLKPAMAGALVVLLAFAWLSWPIWMAPRLKGDKAGKIAQALVNPHPLFVLNARLGQTNNLGEFQPAFPVPWVEHRIAYRLTNLGDDVPFHPPHSVWPFILVHSLFLFGLLCKGAVSELGPYAKAAFLAAMGVTLPAMGMVVVLLLSPLLAPMLKSAGVPGAIVLILSFFILGGFSLVPTWALSGLVGWVYGATHGFLIGLIALCGASMVGYEFARRFAGNDIVHKIQSNPKLGALHFALTGKSFWKTLFIVILIRIPSSSPFAFTNYLLACAKVPRKVYLPGSIVGLAPRTLAVVLITSKLHEFTLDPSHGEGPILVSFSLLVLSLGALVWIAKSTLKSITSTSHEAH